MKTLPIVNIVFRGLVSLFIITYLLIQCSTKQTEVPEIKIAKPAIPLTVWDKIKKYESPDVPTPDQIEFQVLALIKKAETRGYRFETYGPELESLNIIFAAGAFGCYKSKGQINLVTCSVFEELVRTYFRDEISADRSCPGFGLIRSRIERLEYADGIIDRRSDGVEEYPEIRNTMEATKEQLNDINKKYLALLRYFIEELL